MSRKLLGFMHFLQFRLLSNMDVILVWAWMLWYTSALEHGCYSGLGMDALVDVCSQTWILFWFGHGCSCKRMLSNMDVIMVWA